MSSTNDKAGGEAQPTRGPYAAQEGENACVIWGRGDYALDKVIARTEREKSVPPSDTQHIVNARLLASSWDYHVACTPERLAALQTVIHYAERYDRRRRATIDAALALLTDLRRIRAGVVTAGGGGEAGAAGEAEGGAGL